MPCPLQRKVPCPIQLPTGTFHVLFSCLVLVLGPVSSYLFLELFCCLFLVLPCTFCSFSISAICSMNSSAACSLFCLVPSVPCPTISSYLFIALFYNLILVLRCTSSSSSPAAFYPSLSCLFLSIFLSCPLYSSDQFWT